MIFKVPENYKGSFSLGSLNKSLWAGCILEIDKYKIRAADVKAAIRNKALIPMDDEEVETEGQGVVDTKNYKDDTKVLVKNVSGGILILDGILIKDGAATYVSREQVEKSLFLSAEEQGIIEIKRDKVKVLEEKEVKDILSEIENEEDDDDDLGEFDDDDDDDDDDDMLETTPVVWDFDNQKLKDAEKINNSNKVINLEEEKESADTTNKKIKKTKKKTQKRAKKKTTKRKTTKKRRKKVAKKTTKKKQTKPINPIGEQRKEKTIVDDLMEPQPVKPSDVVKDLLIDLTEEENNTDFVDKEQEIQRINERKKEFNWDD